MISGYGKADPGTSFFHTKVENQARTGQTCKNFQRLPFGFTILKSGPPSCAGIRKEKKKVTLYVWSRCSPSVTQTYPKWSQREGWDSATEENKAVIREDGGEQKEKQTQAWTYQLNHDGRWGGILTPVETMVRSRIQSRLWIMRIMKQTYSWTFIHRRFSWTEESGCLFVSCPLKYTCSCSHR